MAEKKKIIKPRAAKDMKPDSLRQRALDSAKKAPKAPRSTGTMTSGERIGDVKKTRASRFKPPALRSTTEPTKFKKPSTSVTEYRKPSTSVTEYRKPSTGVAEYKGGSSLGRAAETGMGTIAKRAFALAGGPAIELAAMTEPLNKGEAEWIASKNRGPLMKGNTSVKAGDKPRPMTFGDKGNAGRVSQNMTRKAGPNRTSGGTGMAAVPTNSGPSMRAGKGGTTRGGFDSKETEKRYYGSNATDNKAAKFKALQQGQKASAGPNVKKAGDKSRVAGGKTSRPDGKLSSFEQMKKRQYERDFTARPMTSSQAKSKVVKERGYKFKDLFK